MTITSANFISEIVLFLRGKLRDNIIDPINRTTDFVFTAYPKTSVQYPIITVKVNNISTESLGMQSETVLSNLDIEARVWARNSKEADTLTQDVIKLLREAHFGTGSTNAEDILGFRLASTNSIVEQSDTQTIHSKVLNFKYQFILT